MRASTASDRCTVNSTEAPFRWRLQDLCDLHARIGVEALARHEDQARIEAAEQVAADEDAGLAPVAQAQDPQRRLEQVFLVDLEELVARVILQHREQVLVHVAVLPEARALDHRGDLAAKQRHLARLRVIRGRRVQAHETALARDPARGIEALHADVVEVSRAMHGGARVGLREHEQLRIARQGAKLRRQLLEARRQAAQLGLAQHAQARARPRCEAGLRRSRSPGRSRGTRGT